MGCTAVSISRLTAPFRFFTCSAAGDVLTFTDLRGVWIFSFFFPEPLAWLSLRPDSSRPSSRLHSPATPASPCPSPPGDCSPIPPSPDRLQSRAWYAPRSPRCPLPQCCSPPPRHHRAS